jgi:hypothetical protein
VTSINAERFRSNDLGFLIMPKITQSPLHPILQRKIVLFSDDTCPDKFQDTKVLIIWSSRTQVVVFEKKSLSRFYCTDPEKAYPEDKLLLSLISEDK